MHIFRWLMSHPIITAWILAALAILLNINMGSKNQAEHGDNESASHLVASKEAPSQGQMVTDSTKNSEKPAKVEHEHASESFAHSDSAPSESITAQVSENATPVNTINTLEGKHSLNTKTNSGISKSVASTEAASEAIEDLTSMNSEDLLMLAREAFWQNKKDRSATIYQALVKRTPSSLAYKGELANVLWHQNKQKESAALYAEIAMPLLKEGKSREVANMLGFIGVFFPEKASEIHRSMSE